MPTDCVTYQESGYFSKIIVDYLNQNPNLKPFYNHFPNIDNFAAQMSEKSLNYNYEHRKILVEELEKQYKNIVTSEFTLKNIQLLNNSNTYTITTGHQLNLFTGPLYFLYKIISTINLCKELKAKYPENNFVPIYWMATEDHDFDEINYFNFKSKKIRWSKKSSGPVGRLDTNGLQEVYKVFEKELGFGDNANYLKKIFQEAYLKNDTLADATRHLANSLFKTYGLVILDADNRALKKTFIPYIANELTQQQSFAKVTETINGLHEYDIQVNPREINLFYIEDDLRERIVIEEGNYKINNTKISFTENEILGELNNFPEKFSPNVIMRPLYQEVILPNLCYIGGGGDIAYWLELQSMFSINNTTFPILLLRNSVLLATEKQFNKADKLDLRWHDLFKTQQELIKNQTINKSDINIDFSSQKQKLNTQFQELHEIAKKTDKSFVGAVAAQEKKQIKGLENLEKRLLKAQKRVLKDFLTRTTDLQNQLFPNQLLQERQLNFSELYLEFGELLIKKIFEKLKPLNNEFDIVLL
ncbi:MAG: bacillithiol biosynthesis cysteine-adding enzyme BshC [Flavobacterium sp.]|nr:bacillithiol biosynthesis cysteine-adding enzyme BshC [Flavobacterium sp.]